TDAGLIDAVRAMAALSPAAMRRRRRAARARAIERFDARRMLGRYSDIYAERTNGAVRLPDTNLDVSVVIPVRDTPGAWLAESIESVLAQGDCEGLNPQSSILDPRFEIVLVDDGSTRPDTLAVIDAAARDPRVRVIRQTHAGVGAALNAGVRTARAEIIARHDADDVMLPGRLAAQLARLRADPDLALVAGQMIVTDADGRDIRELALIFDPATPLTHQPFAIAHPAVCVRRAAVLSAGGYGDGAGQDLDLWCRMQLAGLRMLVTADLVTRYRTHPAQVTARSDAARLREIVRGRYESRFAADPRFSNAMNAAPRASARG
ncbi:glycosyltransferase, partial [bacterium]|nr:glycosyltransferase [bacterium]